MDDLDHSVLLFRGHLVVAGEAEASAEDVCSDVDAGAGDIGVALSSAVTLHRDKGVGTIDRLHVHGLPDRASFGV